MFTHYDADINPPRNSSARGNGVEASSDNRCPCCDSPKWCFILGDGNAVICERTDVPPEGWEQTGAAKDGRPIYAKIGTRQDNRRYKGILPEPVNIKLEIQPKTDFPQWVDVGTDYRGIKELQMEFLYPDTVTGEPLGKVVRKQWEDRRRAYNDGKDTKHLRPWHWAEPYHPDQGSLGWWSDRGKGSKLWSLYREAEVRDAITSGECSILFYGTGEQAVESYRRLGLYSTCAAGGEGTNNAQVIDFLKRNTPQVFVIAPDEDEAGHKAAAKLQEGCNRVKLPTVTINLKNIWANLPHRGDITDILQKSGMSESEIVKRLEAEIRRAIAARLENDRKLNDPDERLKLDLQSLLQESDPIKRMRRRSEIASHYRLKTSDIQEALKYLEQQTATPAKNWFTFDEFFNQESEALQWVVPQLLPRGETVLLAAQAKCGKTALATDIMYGVLSGGTVIGEQVGVKGKVLLISSDESPNSTRRRMQLRGFDLLDERSNFHLMTHLDITNLAELESRLEDFRPDLVVIDSLTTICSEVGISEKDPEFARYIYKLKTVLGRYNAACILTHHENKDPLAKGINQVSGSARIPAAVWGILQLKAVDPNNDADPQRFLKIKPREGEATIFNLEMNPKDMWLQYGIWACHGEVDDTTGEKKTQGEQVLDLLQEYSPKGLTYQEIDNALKIGRSLYQVLDRLEDRQLVTKRRSEFNSRQWVYSVPQQGGDTPPPSGDTPPPSVDQTGVVESPESVTSNDFQQFNNEFNNYSTPIQQPDEFSGVLNDSNPDSVTGSTPIQQPDNQRGGEGVLNSTNEGARAPDNPPALVTDNNGWFTEECLQDMAANLENCPNSETLAEFRQCWPSDALSAACKLLQPETQQRIKGWVLGQNARLEDASPEQDQQSPAPATTGFKVGDAVSLADINMVAYTYHGTVEEVVGDNILVRWAERTGKPFEYERYDTSELIRLE
jgi:KaiC/GvpD/RAD55 family RecA-like ATPase